MQRGFVLAVILSPTRDHVVLMRKNRPAQMKGLMNFPGGHIEQGESALQAVQREAFEECGYTGEFKIFAIISGGGFDDPDREYSFCNDPEKSGKGCFCFYSIAEPDAEISTKTDEVVGIHRMSGLLFRRDLCNDITILMGMLGMVLNPESAMQGK